MEQQKQGAEEPKQQTIKKRSIAEHQKNQLRCWMEGRGWAEAEAESIHRAGRARSKKQEVEAQQEQQNQSRSQSTKRSRKDPQQSVGKIKWGVGRKGRRFVKAEAKGIHTAGRAGARSKKRRHSRSSKINQGSSRQKQGIKATGKSKDLQEQQMMQVQQGQEVGGGEHRRIAGAMQQ
jgi:hypothetical protein